MTTAASVAPEPADSPTERAYRRGIFAWSLYDWADHAFITSTASTFFPPYFIAIAAPAFLEAGKAATDSGAMALARDNASNAFAITISLSLLLAAVLAPILGTIADLTGTRKRILVIATIIGGIIASLMFTLTTGMWVLGLVLYAGAQIALNVALGLNSSLLPHITRPSDMNRASSLGYAMGYFGGGVLLAINTALYLFSDKLGIDSGTAVRIAFLLVGIWWIAFMIPMARAVPEPPALPLAGSTGNVVSDTFKRLGHTLREIQRYRELFKMLIAFWLYSEGIGAIILLATAYGAALGLTTSALITTLLMTQFVAFPFALIYGRIPDTASKWRAAYVSMLLWTAVTLPLLGMYASSKGNGDTALGVGTTFALIGADQLLGILFSLFIGRHLLGRFTQQLTTKRTIILGLAIYAVIPIWGYFLTTQAEFFMIGWMVGTVQGGTQALSRAIYAQLLPTAKSGEFFGLYGLSEKFAGLIGPALYALVGAITHSPQDSVLSVTVFFLVGILVLARVDVAKGTEIADAENAAELAAHAAP